MAKTQKQEKLNLDDIDFDAAMGVEFEDAPEDLKLDTLGDEKDDVQPSPEDNVEDSEDDDSEDTEDDESTDDKEAKSKEGSDDDQEDDEDSDDDDENEGDELPPLINEVRNLLGIDIDDEFEDTTEGLVELTKKAASKMADTQLDELFEALPDVEQYLKYRLQGGDSAQFFSTFYGNVDYETTEVKEDDVNLQEHLVRQAMELKGFETDDIKKSVEEFKNTGILHSQAQMARKGLAKYQQREQTRLLEEQERTAAEAQQQTQKFWDEVSTTIQESRELHGIPISEKDKKELLNYVARPGKNGLSEFQVAMNEAPTDVYLAIAALMKRNFDLSGLVSRKASTKQAQDLRNRLSKTKQTLRSKDQKSKGNVKEPDFESLDLSI